MKHQSLKNRIVNDLLIPEDLLTRIIQRAPHTYKVYTIAKRSKGRRTIAQPARETKFVQHWLINNVFNNLPIHDAATAYKKNSSIKKNASIHAKNNYISKFDFKDFFTSIKTHHLESHLTKHLRDEVTEVDINDILRLSCIKPKNGGPMCLSVGSPCSPLLSNSIMYEFDLHVSKWCKDNNLVYTRYADDLTFSTNEKNICLDIEPILREIVKILEYPQLRFNRKKTIHLSKKNQRKVTGIILNNEGDISIGRSRKREISALIHKHTISLLDEDTIFKLQGLLGFANDIEPAFIQRMNKKYGHKIVKSIFNLRKPKKLQER